MKKIYIFLLGVSLLFLSGASFAQSYKDSPLNYKNSPLNYDNSPLNYKNSPLNYKNSPLNPNGRGVFDESGNRQGYVVPKSDGSGVNIFNNDGDRTGYYNWD